MLENAVDPIQPSLRFFLIIHSDRASSLLPDITSPPDPITPGLILQFLPLLLQADFIDQGRQGLETTLTGFRVGFNTEYQGYCFYMSCQNVEHAPVLAIQLEDAPTESSILQFCRDLETGAVFNSPVPPLTGLNQEQLNVIRTPDGFSIPLKLKTEAFDEVFLFLKNAQTTSN